MTGATPAPTPGRASLVRGLASVVVVVATLVAGLWFWSGVVAPGYWSSIVLGAAWFVAASIGFGQIGKRRPDLRLPLRATVIACSVAACVGFYWTSVRDTVVDEQIVTGVPASELDGSEAEIDDALAGEPDDSEAEAAGTDGASKPVEAEEEAEPEPARNVVRVSGEVRPAGHSASGRARVVELAAGGRVLTLSDDFEIDPGPEVRVYLVPDPDRPTEGVEDLGELKGSKGDQQYEIPDGVDVFEHRHVVFWCVPFTQTLATAKLDPQ